MKKKVFFIIIAVVVMLGTGCAPIEGGELNYSPYAGGESVLVGDLPRKLPQRGHFVVIDLLDNYGKEIDIRIFFQGEQKCNLRVANPLEWEVVSPLYFNSTNCPGLRIQFMLDFENLTALQSTQEHSVPLPVYIGIAGSDLYYQWETEK